VVSSGAIQKRKYTRGYHVDIKQKAEKPSKTYLKESAYTNESFARVPDESHAENHNTEASDSEGNFRNIDSPALHCAVLPEQKATASIDGDTEKSKWSGIKKVISPLKSLEMKPTVFENRASVSAATVAYDKSQLIKWSSLR